MRGRRGDGGGGGGVRVMVLLQNGLDELSA